MHRLRKLIFLLLLSSSVYFIYQTTHNATYHITSIGDGVSLGINSYGIQEYSYIDYLEEELQKKKENVISNKEYARKDQSIRNVLNLVKQTPNIKKELSSTNLLILTLGYNDLVYSLSIEENLTESKLKKIIEDIDKDYQELIKEIQKYYHEEIIVIGYFDTNSNSYYRKKGIKELNKVLQKSPNVTYIDTYSLLENRQKYFQNPNSYYPNRDAYKDISRKIIRKTLEKP